MAATPIARSTILATTLCLVVGVSGNAAAQTCQSSGIGDFMTKKWVTPALCVAGSSWHDVIACIRAEKEEYAQMAVLRDAADAALSAFRADCKVRNAEAAADRNRTDSLANADAVTRKLGRDISGRDGIRVASLGDPRTNSDAYQRVGRVGLALAGIHQTAFGELDRTMREFATTGIAQPPQQTVRTDGRWAVIATPPSATELADAQSAARQREAARRRVARINSEVSGEIATRNALIRAGLSPGGSPSSSTSGVRGCVAC